MKFFDDCVAALLAVTDFFTLSPLQRPLQDMRVSPFGRPIHPAAVPQSEYIRFPPPHLNDPDRADFQCHYPDMLAKDWDNCSTPDNRGCWLRNKHTGEEFNITTDYEKLRPNGTIREYELNITRANLTLDGVTMPHGVVFDDGKSEQKYPGPWIRACWGDTIRVTVHNNLDKYNGSTVHWHGIRQLNTMQMDGVNGVTQCPIAPGKSFVYQFDTYQYGTSWYHSHYSLQYADGLVGPMTIYGPSSANWDEAKHPTLMTDWDHRSAFEDYSRNNWAARRPTAAVMDSILLNGLGNFAGMNGAQRYNLTFEPGKKYYLRLINTAADTAFVFAIDNHTIEVMSSDFVPIKPYKTNKVTIGIGQRYHIVVHAPTLEELEAWYPNKTLDQLNFWLRTIPAQGCSRFELGNEPDERQGIVRYDASSTIVPRTARNSTIDITCHDEAPKNLKPVFEWQVGDPVNQWTGDDYLEVGISKANKEDPYMYGEFDHWSVGSQSLWLNFSDPSIKHINDPPAMWNRKAVILPENVKADDWVYLLISGTLTTNRDASRKGNGASHPIHLHGHDFAILKQSSVALNATNFKEETDKKHLNLKNPPRRDVALLSGGGHLIIAFKADNPGVWLMHCHIAFHASGGLAMQILERQKDIKQPLGWADQVLRGCGEWEDFYKNDTNLWDPKDFDRKYFQDDSGI